MGPTWTVVTDGETVRVSSRTAGANRPRPLFDMEFSRTDPHRWADEVATVLAEAAAARCYEHLELEGPSQHWALVRERLSRGNARRLG